MPSPLPRRASDAYSKVPIPRLAKPHPASHGAVDKPRASRACLGCRQLKMRCSGESPCQRCIANKKTCAYPQARKERLKSTSEQNEHMLKLMRHLKDRVTDEDRQQIEDLLERISRPGARRRGRGKSPGRSDAEDGPDAPSDVIEPGSPSIAPPRPESVAEEFTGKLSNLQWSQRESHPESDRDMETSPKSTGHENGMPKDEPISPVSNVQQMSPQFGNSALLETFWHLQRASGEDALEFLDLVRSSSPQDTSSIEQWLRARQTPRTESSVSTTQDASNSPIYERPAVHSPNWSGNGQDRRLSNAASDILPEQQQPLGQHVTVGTVKSAVDMFYRSTGLLFYIVPKAQIDTILTEAMESVHCNFPDDAPFTTILKSSTSLQARARLAELCGMAAIGLLYLRISDQERAPPAKLGHYFYSITKQMLDSSIEANPLRSMKVCALLTLYNIYVKAGVALAYVELGLGLAQSYGLHVEAQSKLSVEEYRDYKRTWRTLLTLNGWLAASLGYASGQAIPNLALLDLDHDAREEDILQQQLVKVTIIKARIIRAIPDDSTVDDDVIEEFRTELNEINENLPEWMTMRSLISGQQTTPLRQAVMYFHLFFLSAMQLLHRRTMVNAKHPNSSGKGCTKTGVRDGLMAAKMVARMFALMKQEGYIGQFCWMCIYSSYTSGIIILQAAVQKILTGYHSSTWIADLTLANICVQVLQFCGEVDSIAARMKEILHKYMDVIRASVNAMFNADPGADNNEDEIVDYLFVIPPGDSDLHKASRDLLCLIQYPFGTSLELIPEGGPKAPPLRTSQVNWMEAAVGIPQEWDWELQKCGLKPDAKQASSASQMRDAISTLTPGRFVPMGDTAPWTSWTEHSF